jgi:hypothetical protein
MLDVQRSGTQCLDVLAEWYPYTRAKHMNRFIQNLSAKDYHADPCDVPSLTQSIANEMLTRSPWHAHRLHPKLGGKHRKPTIATDDGSLLHAVLLGDDDAFVVVDVDDFRTKEARRTRDDAIEAGKVVIKKSDLTKVMERAARIDNDLRREHGIVLGSMQRELTAVWSEQTDTLGHVPADVTCRARLDAFDGETIYDLKTCADASPGKLARSAIQFGYHVQAAAYVSAVEHIVPDMAGRINFVDIFIENETLAISVTRFAGSFMEAGRARWQAAVDAWHGCLSSGRWPGYSGNGEPMTLESPEWYRAANDSDLYQLRERMTFHV